MPVTITTTVQNDNPGTIWNKLAAKLGRQPTNEEARQEVLRILRRDQLATASRAYRARYA